ncbi:CoA transferase [Ornithinimicrobium cryptoxanthini]|uniref:CoA transferase n=1 Tax=Ornithinimicrobium cryptoxanthini TaxID=2934161 RepID=A0ABY4YGX3_9MICO|nr:CoA transferase [Ornithinimicrobium cryptoxanthini]USQ75914.1 CoA transferase [Ornithinimicrobium cryptoxanthini]
MTGRLAGVRVVSLAGTLPGPVAARRLRAEGAEVIRVEGPGGDILRTVAADLVDALVGDQQVIRLNLKEPADRARLHELLDEADLLLTSSRPSALARLGLTREVVAQRWPRLGWVAIVGETGERAEEAGHDLTYQAQAGLLGAGTELPRVLLADLSAAERVVTECVLALRQADLHGSGGYAEVGLVESARDLGEPLRHGLTAPGGILGGGHPAYAIYLARSGRVAVAALEPHFWARLLDLLGIGGTHAELAAAFLERDAQDWEAWGSEHDVPVVAVL